MLKRVPCIHDAKLKTLRRKPELTVGQGHLKEARKEATIEVAVGNDNNVTLTLALFFPLSVVSPHLHKCVGIRNGG